MSILKSSSVYAISSLILVAVLISGIAIFSSLQPYPEAPTGLAISQGPNYYFDVSGNPDLYCIQVDDSTWSANAEKWIKDDHAVYSEDCGYSGIEEFLTAGTEISIFPNPAGNSFIVSFELETPKILNITLTDLSGKELQEFSLANIRYVNEEIDVSGLSAGVYFLRISFSNKSISSKIVVE